MRALFSKNVPLPETLIHKSTDFPRFQLSFEKMLTTLSRIRYTTPRSPKNIHNPPSPSKRPCVSEKTDTCQTVSRLSLLRTTPLSGNLAFGHEIFLLQFLRHFFVSHVHPFLLRMALWVGILLCNLSLFDKK